MIKFPFEKQSKATWIDQVNAELKGGHTYDSLIHSTENELDIEPFYHPDDHVHRSEGYSFKPDNNWHILDCCSVGSLEHDVETALAYDIHFLKIEVLTSAQLDMVHSIMLKYPTIRCHLYLADFILVHALPDIAQIVGVRFAIYDKHLRDQLIDWNSKRQHSASVIYAELNYDQNPAVQLTLMLNNLVDWFELADIEDISKGVIVNLEIGTNYLLEIAKLRAVKHLLQNFWTAYKLGPENLPVIEGSIGDATTSDPEISLISLASRAVSAVIGGVDFMSVEPPQTTNEHLYRKTVRSLQHLLKLEGLLDKVADPTAGSYQIEKMTQVIATKSWHSFQKIRGGQGASGNNK